MAIGILRVNDTYTASEGLIKGSIAVHLTEIVIERLRLF